MLSSMVADATSPIRLIVVEDHPLVRSAIVDMLKDEPTFDVCGEADNSTVAMELIARVQPDIVIWDITLKDGSSIDTLQSLKKEFPNTRILVFSGHDEMVYAPRMIRAGASGFVRKEHAVTKLISAIHKVAKGEIYLSEEVEMQLLQRLARSSDGPTSSSVELLSNRELEVFTLIAQGCSTSEIAERLNVSMPTIHAHCAHIKKKLDLKSGVELLQRAVEWLRNQPSSETPS